MILFKDEQEFKMFVLNTLNLTYEFDICCHEDKYKAGIPDSSYASQGVQGWIEFKFSQYAKFEPRQPKWLERRAGEMIPCWVLWGMPDRSCRLWSVNYECAWDFTSVDEGIGSIAHILLESHLLPIEGHSQPCHRVRLPQLLSFPPGHLPAGWPLIGL